MGEGVHTISNAPKTDRSYLHDTDGGLNRQEAFRVSQLEAKIRNRRTEKGYIIGADGQIISESVKGTRNKAKFNVSDLRHAKDAVLTHNHPGTGLYDTLAGRIGNPFSQADIELATQYNMKEIRAVTKTYTYSIRRPKGGWGDPQKIKSVISSMHRNAKRGYDEYTTKPIAEFLTTRSSQAQQRLKEAHDRGNVGVQWSNLRKVVKELGWTLTRRKVN